MERFVKLRCIACFVPVSLALLRSASGQGFANLDFENAIINTVHNPGGDTYTATVFGWGVIGGGQFSGDPSTIPFNSFALDAPYVTLQGTNSRNFPAIQGQYSILLQCGTSLG